MLSYLKWLFTAKKDRAIYLLDSFNNYIAGDKRLETVITRLTVATTVDEFRITISNDKYSAEQLWKAHCTNTINIYTPTMDYPNSKFCNKIIAIILEKVAEIDTAVDRLSKYHHRLFEHENFNMASFCDKFKIYESVSLCPAGVLPLIDATEKDLQKTEWFEEPKKRKTYLDAYYQYIIKAFQDYLDGGTPHCFSPYIQIMSFESWREILPELEREKLAEAEAAKKCARVLGDIKGISNMGGGASCAAS